MPYAHNDLLGRLVGMRLLAVEFVLDYLMLRFDADPAHPQAVLTCDVMPHVERPDGVLLRDGDGGYTDALRALIDGHVTSTSERPRGGICIEVGGRGVLVLDPSLDELIGPEIALLRGFPDDAWMCWRPGEEAFEHLG